MTGTTHAGKNAVAEFKAERIPGSSFYDTDGIADPSAGLPVRYQPAHIIDSAYMMNLIQPATTVRSRTTTLYMRFQIRKSQTCTCMWACITAHGPLGGWICSGHGCAWDLQ